MSYSVQILRRQSIKGNGKSQLQLRIIIDRKIKYYPTKQDIEPKYWDDKKNTVRNSFALSIKLQNLLDDIENKAKQVFYDLSNDNLPITFENFEERYFGNKTDSKDFYALVRDYIAKNKHLYKASTLIQIECELNKLSVFKPIIRIQDIDYNFYREYEQHLYGIKNTTNTVGKSLKKLRSFENALSRAGLLKKSNSDSFKIKEIPSSRQYLTLDELMLLGGHYAIMKNEKLKNVLRNFLFCCYTGIRFQTLSALKYSDIENDSVLVKDITQVKNNEIISVPLSEYAIRLLPDDVNLKNNAGDNRNIFRVCTNQKANDMIKTVADIAGINKNIHFHMARHTFATISLNIGIPIEVVQRLLGHRSIKTTQIYAKIVEKTKFEQMKKWDNL